MKLICLFFLFSILCFGCNHQVQEKATSLSKELAKTSILSSAFDSLMQEVRTLPTKQRIQFTLNVANRKEEIRDGLIKQEHLLLEILPLGSKKEKKNILSQLIEIYIYQDKAKITNAINKGVTRCKELLNKHSLTQEKRWEILKKQALLLNELGKQDEYLPIWYQLLNEHRTANKPELIIEDFRAIAGHFNKLKGKRECLDLYQKAYFIAEKEHFTKQQEECINVLINLLYDTGSYQETLKLCKKAIIDSITTFPSSVHSIQAKCHLQLHQPDSARSYLNKMLKASNQNGKMSFYCRMAETYLQEEKEDSATVFLNRAVTQYKKQVGKNSNMLLPGIFLPVYTAYASLLHRNSKLQEAQKAFSFIESLMKETIEEPTQAELQIDALTRYSAFCRTQGKTQKALDLLVYKDSIREIHDSIRKELDGRNQIAIFQSNELIHKNELQKKELDNSERINNLYLFGGAIVTLLLIGYIWGTGKLRSQVKLLLKENSSLKETTKEAPKATVKSKKKKEAEVPYIPLKSKELFAKAEQAVTEQKLFANKKLKLDDLVKITGTNVSTLSECINANAQMNFNDWINKFRIRYIIQHVSTTSQIGQLYHEAGFASRSAFYASFKKEMGCTPTEYLKSQGS